LETFLTKEGLETFDLTESSLLMPGIPKVRGDLYATLEEEFLHTRPGEGDTFDFYNFELSFLLIGVVGLLMLKSIKI
jgi:hypothetical protein